MRYAPTPPLAQLRTSIRKFLGADRAGFVGLTVPAEYGGRGLGYLHRYVVTEELLAQWLFSVHRADLGTGHHDQPDRADERRAPFQRGHLLRRVHPR
jgi:alkylation response protein AidB-like acyl-CoA dehydrogenase